MKKIRKMLVTVLAVAMVCCFTVWFAACGNTSVEGTWYFESTTMNSGGVEVSYKVGEETEGVTITKEFMKMVIKSDGTVEMTGMMSSGSGTWKQDGKTVTITIEGEALEGTISGNKLTITRSEEGMTSTLVLKKG